MNKQEQLLNEQRCMIDELDDLLINIFSLRLNVVKEIGLIKKTHGLDIDDDNRELMIINKIKEKHLNDEKQVLALYQLIFNLSKEIQEI
ncbi:MAG: chorismate mutase [Bacilli bacterium]|jgi:chorismate mutase|nr:chorismate mutase [Bacilli bacterium]